jgi:hypothetical protein
MSVRSLKATALVTAVAGALVGLSLSVGASAAVADAPPVPGTTTLVNSLTDTNYQACVAEHDVSLQLVYIESYPSQPPVPGFCTMQNPDEVGLANYVLPLT